MSGMSSSGLAGTVSGRVCSVGSVRHPMTTRQPALPRPLFYALVVCTGFAAFLAWDLWHWWTVKDDYSFGFLVPLFVGYVVFDRWEKIVNLAHAKPKMVAPAAIRLLATIKATVGLIGGLLFFGMGAFYRAGAGTSQPGSLAMALGFAAILVPLVFLSGPDPAPDGVPEAKGFVAGIRASVAEPRYEIACLFIFPALVWIVSAPLVSAIENTISLFLLNKVTVVVFFLFDMLGLPLERHGNVLALPLGEVGVAEACSGIRSLTGSIFAGSFLAAVFLDKLWKKIGLVLSAMVLAFFTNILRSVFLTAWAYENGPEAIEGAVHDVTGYAVLGVTTVGLLILIPIFNFRLVRPDDLPPPPPRTPEPQLE